MKINFLTIKFNGKTGGVIYDEVLCQKIKAHFGEGVRFIDDTYWGKEGQDEIVNHKRFGRIYSNHAEELFDCDYLITNSRLYTRFLGFPWGKINKKCKLILIHHHFNYMTQNKWLHYIVHKYLELSFLRRADWIITPNLYVMDSLKKTRLREKTMLIEAYIDNTINQVFKSSQKQILFMGTIEPRKGIHYGIEAFYKFAQKHSDYSYVIVGTFDEKKAYCQKLLQQVRDYNLEEKVKFLGRVDDETKAKLFAESQLFLFPSQNEGYGLVLVEAMSYGIPVVAFNNTAMPYTVNCSNGAIVPNKDIRRMAEAMEQILGNEAEYDRLSEGAKKTVRGLPSKEVIDQEYNTLICKMEEGDL